MRLVLPGVLLRVLGEGWVQVGCSGYTHSPAHEHQMLLKTWLWGQDYTRQQFWHGRKGKGSVKPDYQQLPGGLDMLRPLGGCSRVRADLSPLGDGEQLKVVC